MEKPAEKARAASGSPLRGWSSGSCTTGRWWSAGRFGSRFSSQPRLWVADITYVRSREGFLYLAFILDVCSRRVVGWSMATHLRTQLVVDALQMAIARRKPPPGLVHHSERGVQYTSLSFSKRLEERVSSRRWAGRAPPMTMPWPNRLSLR